ncbi:hypothetical protein SHANETTE_41 [Bacillus phage Shanette]|uniref:Uncharacterized protein n=1 Tax=Bacillus phage Shanette TaxID=1296656 RepID=S5M9C7_9CAUD|nr:hypothetical protein AVV46_gp041 [Bacillus phage Shanette]AGR47133.1 hypothetical protein SHANETTE_41 [Bacillus phage Shanette]
MSRIMMPFFGSFDNGEDREPSKPREVRNMTEKEFRVAVLKGLVAIEYAVRTQRRHYWASDMEWAVSKAQSMVEEEESE